MMMIKVTTHPNKRLFSPFNEKSKTKKLFLQYYKPFKKALPLKI